MWNNIIYRNTSSVKKTRENWKRSLNLESIAASFGNQQEIYKLCKSLLRGTIL